MGRGKGSSSCNQEAVMGETTAKTEEELYSLREIYKGWSTLCNNGKHPMAILSRIGIEFEMAEQGMKDEMGAPQACWGNAALLSLSNPERYVYMEGSVCVVGWVPIDHAWVYDRLRQKHLEVTIRFEEMDKKVGPYLGLPFPCDFVHSVAEETGGYSGVFYMHSRAHEIEGKVHMRAYGEMLTAEQAEEMGKEEELQCPGNA
jgi:hypothetical protein